MSMPTTETNNIKPVRNLVSTPVTIYLTGGLLIILTGFFSFFFCGSFLKKLLNIWNNLRNRNRPSNLIQPSIPPEHAGLGSKIIQSFPEFPYSVKDRGMDQCSICLIDFMDDDTMRLISTCNHFFHTICIDLWFESHKTCPVYRCELDVHKKSSRLFLKTINGRYQIKGLYGILQDIHNLTCYLSTSVFSFISRKDNVAADNLAKKALLNFFNCM
ncbi:hypothetical protein HID58_080004 [Brassica napus]|uniref:RING-type E3 ubiquitin transferase n=1 Tax=Brassica napus TaxID=3708 RepID=A0ABQ7Y3P1_BRANA|nr:hypothetical protein HID58_080004 [Brassica napus]